MALGRTSLLVTAIVLLASSPAKPAQQASPAASGGAIPSPVVSDAFVIGPEDELNIVFWQEKDISGSVTVRPDGMVTIQLLGDVRAAGSTPSALASEIERLAAKYLNNPNVTVLVRQINSRKVYLTGEIKAPGAYPLVGPLTVMQAIAQAGGLLEYADTAAITVLREEPGRTRAYRFNYKEVSRGRNLSQNVELRPGDTIVVP